MNHKASLTPPSIPTPAWREISHSEHWTMLEDRAHRLLCVRRSSVPIGSLASVQADMQQLAIHVAAIQRDHWRLLIDMREAPLRTDPEFETQIRPYQMKLTAGFKRTATLVRTAVGKLQIARSQRESNNPVGGAFTTETEALAFLFA